MICCTPYKLTLEIKFYAGSVSNELKSITICFQKRFEGTRVTVETFLVWRKQFEIDLGIAAKREREAKDKNKLTGKELFLRDQTLNESDLKFLEDGMCIEIILKGVLSLKFINFIKLSVEQHCFHQIDALSLYAPHFTML